MSKRTGQVLGYQQVAVESDDTLAALVSANPNHQWYWHIIVFATNASSSGTVSSRVNIYYDVEFYDRNDTSLDFKILRVPRSIYQSVRSYSDSFRVQETKERLDALDSINKRGYSLINEEENLDHKKPDVLKQRIKHMMSRDNPGKLRSGVALCVPASESNVIQRAVVPYVDVHGLGRPCRSTSDKLIRQSVKIYDSSHYGHKSITNPGRGSVKSEVDAPIKPDLRRS